MTNKPETQTAGSRAYHHGGLRQALIEATIQLVEDVGADNVTVREAARRAGVSSGAPFRHFATKKALMSAVAEEAMARLRATIEAGLEACRSPDPFAQLIAVADAYVLWAVKYPTHYRVIGDRVLVDFYKSQALQRDNRWISERMLALLTQARDAGALRPGDIAGLALQTRALAYGLARMHVDDHFMEFGISNEQAQAAMSAVLRDFIVSLAREPDVARRHLEAAGVLPAEV